METEQSLRSARAELEELKEIQLERELHQVKEAIAAAQAKLASKSPR